MNLYETNETMKMLGYQYPMRLLCGEGVAGEDFHNLLAAHRERGKSSVFEIGMDAVMLGFIYGIRSERSKKKRQSVKA